MLNKGTTWYHFYNVFGMTRSLTGDWTRDLPHSKPALYHKAIEEAVLDWGLDPGPPALEASTISLGYRGGGPWLGIEPGTSRTRSQHSTTRISRRRYRRVYTLIVSGDYPWWFWLYNKTTCNLAEKYSIIKIAYNIIHLAHCTRRKNTNNDVCKYSGYIDIYINLLTKWIQWNPCT